MALASPTVASSSYISGLGAAKPGVAKPKPVIPMSPDDPRMQAQAKPVIPMSPEVAQSYSQGRAQDWINNPQSGMGGMDAYAKRQNERYAGADQATRDALTADSQRVGYTLTGGGVTGAGVEVGTGTGKGSGAGNDTGSAAVKTGSTPVVDNDPYATKAKQYIDTIGAMQPFKYDPNTDPAYQSLSQANTANAKVANRDMEEDMNSRGILNSTVTSDRATEIYKQGADATTAAIPQLQSNAFNQYQTTFNNNLNLAKQYQDLSNTAFDRQMKTADETGKYMSPEVNSLIQTVLDAKANYGKSGVDNQALTQAADVARGKLSEYGVDPSLFGSNVTLAQAQANVSKAYAPTMAAQTGNVNLITGLASKYPTIPTGTGDALKNSAPAYKQAADLYKSLEGVKTMEGLTNEQKVLVDKLQLSLSQQNADTSSGHLTLAQDQAKQDKADKDAAKKALIATNGALTNALSSATKEDAFAYIEKYASQLDKDGVDIKALYDEINKTTHWDVAKATPGGGVNLPSVLLPRQ